MADTPDLSRIVNLIMENPKLISEIASLARSDSENTAESTSQVESDVQTQVKPKTEARADLQLPTDRRDRLLHAMKPYLSEKRGKTIDTLMNIAGVFHTMKG